MGRVRRLAEEKEGRGDEFFVWAIGASLFANVVAFFGIGYFDQTIVGWYALLAIICTVTLPARISEPAEVTGVFRGKAKLWTHPRAGLQSPPPAVESRSPNADSRPREGQTRKKNRGHFRPERSAGPNRFK